MRLEFNEDKSSVNDGRIYKIDNIGSDTQILSIFCFNDDEVQGISASASGFETYYWTFAYSSGAPTITAL
jgi:hypothetical protein